MAKRLARPAGRKPRGKPAGPSTAQPHGSPNAGSSNGRSTAKAFRPPAVPLIVVDPHFSAWQTDDRLTDSFPQHWTGQNHSMTGLIRIDEKAYRFMGPQPESVPPIKQTSLRVWPTRTIYTFQGAGVELTVTFCTPALPQNLNILSWPITYVTFKVVSTNGKSHRVAIYFDACAEFVVDQTGQRVSWARLRHDGATLLSFGTTEQALLRNAGDDKRIDWGYLYLVLPPGLSAQTCIAPKQEVQLEWAETGQIPASDDLEMPRAVSDGWSGLICAFDMSVTPEVPAHQFLMLAYDDLFSVEYLYRRLRPYWNRNGIGTARMLSAALRDYHSLCQQCVAFDEELMADLEEVGGPEFATLCALAYRQTLGAHKLCADIDGTPLYFSKENFSNGCIGTVDVTYPSAPFFLLFNPVLLEAQLTPIFQYASLPRWRFPFAPHDLGTYPLANGQVYGGGERSERSQMPVEECGNMLLLTAALARAQGHLEYVRKYWSLLTRWAEFLVDKGFDPERQLCTDDFAGRLAHNTNLSIKAILALGAYADLCRQLGDQKRATDYRAIAEAMVKSWVKAASDGDHYRLAFDRPGTWSMKYNLVWDRLLELNLFPPKVLRTELAFYKTQMDRYGLPLDNRKRYAKIDWIFWIAYLADRPEDFQALVHPVYTWASETRSRVPLTDHYWTDTGRQVIHWKVRNIGFQARSVVGGMFLPVLKHEALWRKYLERPKAESALHHERHAASTPAEPKVERKAY